MIEIKPLNTEDIAFWSRPIKIKDLWFNAILQ